MESFAMAREKVGNKEVRRKWEGRGRREGRMERERRERQVMQEVFKSRCLWFQHTQIFYDIPVRCHRQNRETVKKPMYITASL